VKYSVNFSFYVSAEELIDSQKFYATIFTIFFHSGKINLIDYLPRRWDISGVNDYVKCVSKLLEGRRGEARQGVRSIMF
jgi:hypothetical protein